MIAHPIIERQMIVTAGKTYAMLFYQSAYLSKILPFFDSIA